MSGIQHLSQLTSLQLVSTALEFSSVTTDSWAHLTALQSLALKGCTVQAEVLSSLTQLRALSLEDVEYTRLPSFWALVNLTVPALSRLTELILAPKKSQAGLPPAVAAFTALTASTHLRALHLRFHKDDVPADWVLFSLGTVYPGTTWVLP